MLLLAIISITLALVFYSIGVWSEKLQGKLRLWHVIIFWIGFIFDSLGTTLMSKIAQNGFQINFHGITGIVAILLMFFHATWASVVIKDKNEIVLLKFHKFSIFVWLVWLIPYISGAIFGMAR
ncbi:HsmA family protein [Spirochaeta cellobiosiphila]|uniref:HsmA family protein n=1 Tax=Spirochaeta cellobiosiphila TaxID=504483 RepID=UPI0004185614|nr:HsmA family protein [Spirochaeta cellobiosiphila]